MALGCIAHYVGLSSYPLNATATIVQPMGIAHYVGLSSYPLLLGRYYVGNIWYRPLCRAFFISTESSYLVYFSYNVSPTMSGFLHIYSSHILDDKIERYRPLCRAFFISTRRIYLRRLNHGIAHYVGLSSYLQCVWKPRKIKSSRSDLRRITKTMCYLFFIQAKKCFQPTVYAVRRKIFYFVTEHSLT